METRERGSQKGHLLISLLSAISGELAAEIPLSGPGRAESGGGFVVLAVVAACKFDNLIEPADVQYRVACNGVREINRPANENSTLICPPGRRKGRALSVSRGYPRNSIHTPRPCLLRVLGLLAGHSKLPYSLRRVPSPRATDTSADRPSPKNAFRAVSRAEAKALPACRWTFWPVGFNVESIPEKLSWGTSARQRSARRR